MYQIKGITSDAYQKQTLVLPTGKQIVLIIQYIEQQYCWIIKEITYDGTITFNGIKINNNGNLLNQYRNKIPFGLACISASNREPTQIEDFKEGASTLYILTEAEVIAHKELIENGG